MLKSKFKCVFFNKTSHIMYILWVCWLCLSNRNIYALLAILYFRSRTTILFATSHDISATTGTWYDRTISRRGIFHVIIPLHPNSTRKIIAFENNLQYGVVASLPPSIACYGDSVTLQIMQPSHATTSPSNLGYNLL